MNKYKKFISVFIGSLLLLLTVHSIVWNKVSKHVLLIDDMIYNGDLGRPTFKKDSIFSRPSYLDKSANTLPQQHLAYKEIKNNKIDIITIGDSFSNAATQGINPYYQDYIATYNNLNILNIMPDFGIFNTAVILNNNGILDDIKPKAIILQSVERYAIKVFSQEMDFNKTIPKYEVINSLKKQTNYYLKKDEYISFINNQNLKAFKFNIQFLIYPYGKFSNCIIVPMKQNFFTSEDSNSLLFHKEDLIFIEKSTVENVKKLNDNLNILAKELAKKNIKLYFMPVVDKYNLYSKYILDNHYQKSVFFELLRTLPKEYELIDTKMILEQELEKKIKDLYYSDDTHWSFKASEVIFKNIKFE